KPDELYFWDFGRPQGTPTGVASVAVGGSPLYRRDFSNGTVVVNPSSTSATVDLGGTFYDVVNKDASGDPTTVTRVTVGAKDAAFLLLPSGPSPSPSPPPSPSPSPSPSSPPSPPPPPSPTPAPPPPPRPPPPPTPAPPAPH